MSIEFPFPDQSKSFRISFSTYVIWRRCPLEFKLSQIDGVGEPFRGNIYTLFGGLIGEYVEKFFAGDMPGEGIGKRFMIEFEKLCLENKEIIDTHPRMKWSKKMIEEFTDQGLLILDAVRKRRQTGAWKGWKVLGYEVKLERPIPLEFTADVKDTRQTIMENNLPIQNPTYERGPDFKGFIDLLVEDEEGNHLIIDFKTASRPWDKWAKANMDKKAQLKLYKYFYHLETGIPLDKIRTMFIVLPRTGSKRFYQEVEHDFGKVALVNEMKKLKKFFSEVYKQKRFFPVLKESACKWCDFKKTKWCPNS